MNAENFLKLADYLETRVADDEFRMEVSLRVFNGKPCGCIAGHAVRMIQEEQGRLGEYVDALSFEDMFVPIGDFLGLSHRDSSELFWGRWAPRRRLRDITRTEAVAYLRSAASRGSLYY